LSNLRLYLTVGELNLSGGSGKNQNWREEDTLREEIFAEI